MPCPNCKDDHAGWDPKNNVCEQCGWEDAPDVKYCSCGPEVIEDFAYIAKYHANICLTCGGWRNPKCGCEPCTLRPAAPPTLVEAALLAMKDTIDTVVRDLQARMTRMERQFRRIETYTKVLQVRQKRSEEIEEEEDEEWTDIEESPSTVRSLEAELWQKRKYRTWKGR
jgi:hypothetical protein